MKVQTRDHGLVETQAVDGIEVDERGTLWLGDADGKPKYVFAFGEWLHVDDGDVAA